MIRMQVQFSEQQMRLLKSRAAQEQVSVAELVRRAVDAWSTGQSSAPTDERRRRAIAVAGRFASGSRDVAIRHDNYLTDAYRS